MIVGEIVAAIADNPLRIVEMAGELLGGNQRREHPPAFLKVRLDLPAYELVEVPHAVFERGLIRSGFHDALLEQRAATRSHARDDLCVFDGGFAVSSLLGLHELTLEKRDVLR